MLPLLAGLVALASCQPVQVAPFRTDLPATTEVSTFVGRGFLIDHPRDAEIDTIAPAAGIQFAVRFRGPDVALGLPEGTGTWSGPAYALEVLAYDNPRALNAEGWVAERVLATGEAAAADTMHVRVGGRGGVRVITPGSDAWVVNVYFGRDRQMVALRYLDHPTGNNPAAPASAAVHSMMIGTFRYLEQ